MRDDVRICFRCCFSQRQHKDGFCPKKVNGRWDGKTHCKRQKFEGCPVIRESDACANGETMIGQRWR